MLKRLRLPAIVVVALLLGVAAWYEFADGRVPAGQVPLTSISTASLDQVRDEFNRAADQVRIVLLLSPT